MQPLHKSFREMLQQVLVTPRKRNQNVKTNNSDMETVSEVFLSQDGKPKVRHISKCHF